MVAARLFRGWCRGTGTGFWAAPRRVLTTGACLPNAVFAVRSPKDGGAGAPRTPCLISSTYRRYGYWLLGLCKGLGGVRGACPQPFG